jgi:uncharacterized membrane protein HdeD (DUF308 family)
MTAAILAASAAGVFTWRLAQLDPGGPQRLIGALRLSQMAALLLAASGAASIGLAVAQEAMPSGTIEVTFGVAFVVLGGIVLNREPREALLVAAGGFVAHALVDIAHRPGLLEPGLAPRWYAVGSAVFDLYLAALCYWARRR